MKRRGFLGALLGAPAAAVAAVAVAKMPEPRAEVKPESEPEPEFVSGFVPVEDYDDMYATASPAPFDFVRYHHVSVFKPK